MHAAPLTQLQSIFCIVTAQRKHCMCKLPLCAKLRTASSYAKMHDPPAAQSESSHEPALRLWWCHLLQSRWCDRPPARYSGALIPMHAYICEPEPVTEAAAAESLGQESYCAHLLDELCSCILNGILQSDCTCNRHAVIYHLRDPIVLLQYHVPPCSDR